MSYIATMSLLATALVLARTFRSFANPATLASLWWLSCILYSFSSIHGHSPVQEETLLILIGSVHAFSFGVVLGSLVKSKNSMLRYNSDSINSVLDGDKLNPLVIVVALGSFSLSAYGVSSGYQALLSGDAVQYRNEYYESGGYVAYGNVYLTVLRDLFFKPASYVILGVALIGMLQNRNTAQSRCLFAASLSSLALFDAAQLGRTSVVNCVFLMTSIFIYWRFGRRDRASKREVPFSAIWPVLLGCGVIALFLNTISVGRQDSGILDDAAKLFSYFTIGIALFDQRSLVLPSDFNGFIYTIGGLYQLINIITRRIGFEILPSKAMDLQDFVLIGSDVSANALFTWNIAFYADLGIVGCIIFPMMFGIMSGRIYRHWVIWARMSSLLLLSVVMTYVFASVLEWRLMWADQVMLLVMAWMTTLGRKKHARPKAARPST
jgi:oligosaccharide repeat unit polymerase